MVKIEINNGYRVWADVGKILLHQNEKVVDYIFVPKNYDFSNFTEVDDATYVPPIEEPSETADPLATLKKNQILLSKKNLAKYLEGHPLLSTCKYEEGKYYNITEEKQNQLTSTLASYMSDILPQLVIGMSTAQVTITSMEQFLLTLDNLPQTITWNDTGGICETYSYKELYTLKCEIMETVKPLVSLQQTMEVTINDCVTQEEVLNVNVEYTDEQVKKWLETHTL